jgi:hypothetical protein
METTASVEKRRETILGGGYLVWLDGVAALNRGFDFVGNIVPRFPT